MDKNINSTEKGFTLIELVMVAGLFPLMFLAIFSTLSMANVIFQTNGMYSRMSQTEMQALRTIAREVGQTSPNLLPSRLSITTSGANNVLRFQIPVEWDNDGDVTSGTLDPQIEWGAYDNAGQTRDYPANAQARARLGAWAEYSIINNQLVRQVLDATFVPIAGTTRILSNNVTNFSVVKNQNILTMTLTIQDTDRIGQRGAQRQATAITFTTQTALRNAVN